MAVKAPTLRGPGFIGPIRPAKAPTLAGPGVSVGDKVLGPTREDFERARGGGGGSGGQQFGPSRAEFEAEQRRQAEAQRQAEEQRKAEQSRLAELQRKQAEAQAEAERVERQRQKLISEGAKERIIESREAETGQRLLISEVERRGIKIREIQRIGTGKKDIQVFKPGEAGGSQRLAKTVTIKEQSVKPEDFEKKPLPGLQEDQVKKEFDNRFADTRFGLPFIGLTGRELRMTRIERLKSRASEIGTGVVKAGVGITESLVNLQLKLGVQKIQFDKEGNRVAPKKFEVGGRLGEISDRPTTTGTFLGQSLLIVPLVISGISGVASSVKSVGTKETIVRTASSLSPFKIRAGAFGPLEGSKSISDLKFDVVSVKKTTQDGTVLRNIYGRTEGDKSATILVRQVSKDVGGREAGKSIATITAPRTTITPTGSIEEGSRILRVESFFKGDPGKVSLVRDGLIKIPLEGITGTGARVASRTTLDIVADRTGLDLSYTPTSQLKQGFASSIETKKDSFSAFVGGESRKVLRLSKKDFQETFRLGKIDIKGVEFDASTLGRGTGITFTKTSGPKLGLKQQVGPVIPTQVQKTITPSISQKISPQIASVTQDVQSTGKLFDFVPSVTGRSVFTGTGQYELTQQEITSKTIPQIKTTGIEVKPIGKQVTITEQKIETLVSQRSRPVQRERVVQSQGLRKELKTQQRTSQLQDTKQKLKLQQRLKTATSQQIRSPTPVSPRPIETKTPIGIPLIFQKTTLPRRSIDNLSVQVRRGGIFRTVGTGSLRDVFSIGRERVSSTLAATFKITGNGRKIATPKGFRRKVTREGVLFIEKRGRRLSRKTETKEIQSAKKRKRRKKK